MSLLILGLAIFMGVHLLPSAPAARERLRKRFGSNAYRGLFSLVALAGFSLIVVGMGRAPLVSIWSPPPWAPRLAMLVMPIALTLLVAAFLPTNLKRFTRHPMLWGVTVWAAVHLVANGDLASLLLFGSFGAFSLFDMWSANRRGAELSENAVPFWRDILVLAVSAIVYVGFLHSHLYLFGMPVFWGG